MSGIGFFRRWFHNLFGRNTRTVPNRKPGRVRLGVDELESRTLLAAALTASFDYADRVLRIEGTDAADQIRIVNNAGRVSVTGLAIRTTDGGPVWTNAASVAAADIGYIDVRALAGNDLVQVVEQSVTPALAVKLVAQGQQGNDTLDGGSAADGLYGGSGNDVINGYGGADYIEGGYSSDIVSAQAAQLDRDLGLYATDKYEFENWGGRGEKWLWGSTPDMGYFILPNGELYRMDITYQPDDADVPARVDEAKAWFGATRNYAASGTLIATLDPSYFQNPLKLVNASVLIGAPLSQDPLGPQAAQLDRDLGLAVEGEENLYNGQMEKWLTDGRVSWAESQVSGQYFIMPNGELYRWDGNADVLGGTLVATLDASYYQDTTKLADAQYLFGDPTDNDTITGGFGNDTIIGGDGSDSLSGGFDNDRLIGGNDNDFLRGDGGNDELIGCHYGFAGETGGNANDTIMGNNGNDSLYGGDGDDRMEGDNGNDYFRGDGGNDRLYGGYTDATSESGADTIEAGAGNDTLWGGGGVDWLWGQADNDELHGQRGGDALDGGEGNDRLFGEADGDNIVGGEGDDTLDGAAGNDTLWGGFWLDARGAVQDNDMLTGGDGADQLFGGLGNDDLDGGRRGFFDLEVGAMNDSIDGGQGNDLLWGGEGDDTLTGFDGADTLHGESGEDDLDGGRRGFDPEVGTNQDQLFGENGSDIIWGGEGNDTLSGGEGWDTLNGERGQDTLWGGEGIDLLRGSEGSDFLYGENDNDKLYGGAGADQLFGGEGNDGLFGGVGAQDRLTGDGGNDRFLRCPEDMALDSVADVDALFRFDGDGTAVWKDSEIELLDQGLGWLHQVRGNAGLINWNGDDEQIIQRVLGLDGSNGDNDSEGTIRIADAAFSSGNAKGADATIVHEIGHNFDEESPIWDEWLGMSGWDHLGMFEGVEDGQLKSLDGDWAYDANATFARKDTNGLNSYGRTNPMEDWSTFWETAYLDQTRKAGDSVRTLYNFGVPGFQSKLSRVVTFIMVGT